MQSCSISQSSNYIRSGFLSNLLWEWTDLSQLQVVQADPSEPCPEFDSHLVETRADSLRAVKSTSALLAKNESKWNQKAAAEAKEHGVAQKSPISNVANRL